MNFEALSDPSIPRIPLIVHVPHSATTIPPEYRQDFALTNDELARELLLMTDHYTDELAMSAISMGAVIFRNRLSRLVMDPERFADDAAEPMARLGMGAVYVSRQDGASLRKSGFSAVRRERVVSELYYPYHQAVEHLVDRTLVEFGICLIIDLHSFPRMALPYENAQLVRPEVCIGYDDAHVDESILAGWRAVTARAGLSAATNTPFAGSFVPLRFYRRDPRVRSLMIELRRDIYMDETTGHEQPAFGSIQRLTLDLFAVAVSRLTELVRA